MIRGALAEVIGQRVRVHIRLNEASSSFGPQVAVVGTLDGNADASQFRVLTGDPSDRTVSYAYFGLEDVRCWADQRGTSKGTFDCGAVAVVYVGGTTTHPYKGLPITLTDNGITPLIIPADS